ncbi:MAG: polyketide synthase dehydratase domain-containing protein [Syntrophaceae bacterium]|nr:polyketide synthase dehydratase domain-containing protein [Syntrophaceae bacterium]
MEGKAVLPAVEALAFLALSIKSQYPHAFLNHQLHASFSRLLVIPPKGKTLDTQVEMDEDPSGINAALLTSINIQNTGIRRNLEHTRVTFSQNMLLPKPGMSFQDASKLDGNCIQVSAASIYRDLIPFGTSYQNIIGDLSVSPQGALAHISGGTTANNILLGSPFVLDATMHATCVWGQRFVDTVLFPVGFNERILYKLTHQQATYLVRIVPVNLLCKPLIFNAWIFDQQEELCEQICGLQMQDIFGGRIKPPAWIKE